MRIKVELSRNAIAFLDQLAPVDRDDFFAELDRLRAGPSELLRLSEQYSDPSISRYVLRRFAFGRGVAKTAIFEYDAVRARMRVLICRLQRPREVRP